MQQKGLDFDPPAPRIAPQRRGWTVSELTDRIQGALETDFADVWVEGEISNLKIAESGHWYFSLKDDRAQIRAVVWKTSTRLIRFRPKDGMKVLARGGLRVYPPRGEYQLSVEVLEPLGKGSLQQAFEELKERLGREGLFDPKRKRPLPMLPRRVGVVTSPSGAVIQDILRVLKARFSNLEVLLYPARVQGPGAAAEIVQGIKVLNRIPSIDVLIVARGGGSLEDLWAFNEEAVARALAASTVPTISAVGHETDFTIADFVADSRAPTPSAAAERVVLAKAELSSRLQAIDKNLRGALSLRFQKIRSTVLSLTSHRVFEAERGRLRNRAQRVDEMVRRAQQGLLRLEERARERHSRVDTRLQAFRFERQISERRDRVARDLVTLASHTRASLERRRSTLGRLAGLLEGLSPLSVLSRGYALVWDEARGRLVRSPRDVGIGATLEIELRDGRLGATVVSKETL